MELPRDDEGRAAGFGYLRQVTRDTALADMRAVLDHLGDRPVGVLGFSAGGHLAYLAATQLPIRATAVLYGCWLPSTDIPLSQPSPTLELTPGIAEHDGALLYLVGGRDALIPEPARDHIRAALTSAGVRHELVTYPNAEHAFFWEGTPSYDPAATNAAWDRLFEFFDRELFDRELFDRGVFDNER